MVRVLATSWHPSATNAIAPVVKGLRERGDEVTLLGTKYSISVFERAGLEYTPVDGEDGSDINFPESYMGKVIDQKNPDLVLGGTSFQREEEVHVPDQTVVLAARARGIPSLRVQDWKPFGKKYHDLHTGEDFKFVPDAIAVMNEYYRKGMLEEGFPEDRIFVTGNPETDNLQKKAEEFRNRGRARRNEMRSTLRELGANVGNNDILLYYSGGIDWGGQRNVYGYCIGDHVGLFSRVLRENNDPNIQFMLTLHPRMPAEQKELIGAYIDGLRDPRIFPLENFFHILDTEDLSLASDVDLVAFSTVGIKAAYMGRAVISLQPGLIWPQTFEDADPGFFVNHSSIIPLGRDIESCVNLVKNATDKTYLSELESKISDSEFGFGESEGTATKKVIDLIYDMVK